MKSKFRKITGLSLLIIGLSMVFFNGGKLRKGERPVYPYTPFQPIDDRPLPDKPDSDIKECPEGYEQILYNLSADECSSIPGIYLEEEGVCCAERESDEVVEDEKKECAPLQLQIDYAPACEQYVAHEVAEWLNEPVNCCILRQATTLTCDQLIYGVDGTTCSQQGGTDFQFGVCCIGANGTLDL